MSASPIDAIMEQVQVFASTYSLAGSRFDDGSKMQQSNCEKACVREMIVAALPPHRDIDGQRFAEWGLADFAAQCRMQSRDQLDPEFSAFMAELATRLFAIIETGTHS